MRKKRLQKVAKLREKMEEKHQEPDNQRAVNQLTSLFKLKRQGTISSKEMDDQDNEVQRRLRAWRSKRKEYETRIFLAKLAKASVNLDKDQLRIIILKLIQIEKLLKELGKTKKVKGEQKRQKAKKVPGNDQKLGTIYSDEGDKAI